MILLLLACKGPPTPDDSSATDDTGTAACPDGTAWFEGREVTAELDGLVLDSPGTLRFCGGEFAVALEASADVSLVGVAPTVLTASQGTHLSLTSSGIKVVLEDLELTGGNACWASAILAVVPNGCEPDGYQPVTADITLRNVNIHDNTYTIGGGMVTLTGGSSLTLEDSRIADNEGHGVFTLDGSVTCTGSADTDAGIHDNTKTGVWLLTSETPPGPSTITSTGCDWGGAGYNSVILDHEQTITYDYGDDASFTCSSETLSCQ